jgi:hypothetical protein
MELIKYIEFILLIIFSIAILIDSNIKRNLFYTLVTIHLSVPLFLIRKAQDSGVFPMDIILFIALFKLYFLKRQQLPRGKDAVGGVLVIFCCYFALIALPNTYLLGLPEQFAPAVLWTVRFFMYYMIYLLGRKMAWMGIDYNTFAKVNLLAVLPVLIIAAVHYSGMKDFNYSLAHGPFATASTDIATRLHQGVLGHTRASMGVLFMTVFFTTAILYGPKTSFVWKIVAAVVAFTSLVECIYSYSRSALFGIVLGSILILIFSRKFSYLFVMLGGLVLVAAVLQSNPDFNKRFLLKENSNFKSVDKFSAGRLGGWQAAYDGFTKRPFTLPCGLGIRNFRAVLAEENRNIQSFSGHNLFLQTLVETGVVGLIIMLMFQLQLLQKVWRCISAAGSAGNREHRWGAQVFLALFLSVIISAVTQENLWPNWGMHPSNVYLYFVIGVLANVRLIEQQSCQGASLTEGNRL